jgi:hypothetical protein
VGRVDETGAAHAGSQRQTQLWVNGCPDQLRREFGAVFPELAGAHRLAQVRFSPIAA